MKISEPRTAAIARILEHRLPPGRRTTLVVGCGSGREAATLANLLSANVIGIDIVDAFEPDARAAVRLQLGDATMLDFPDRSFDLVYSYHALEHIPDYRKALCEIRRVLKPGATFCVGTPNRSRLIGYIGDSSTIGEKVRWNLADWKARLSGRFRNEYGAHAGFTAGELGSELANHVGNAEEITERYYRELYPAHRTAIGCLVRTHLSGFLFPSVYFAGTRS